MASFRYTVVLERAADGGYHVFCPALKGCHSQGDTLEEALGNIQEAIAAYLESLKAHGQAIPAEDILIRPVEVAMQPALVCVHPCFALLPAFGPPMTPKLPVVRARQVIRVAERLGFVLDRQKGSHAVSSGIPAERAW